MQSGPLRLSDWFGQDDWLAVREQMCFTQLYKLCANLICSSPSTMKVN